jgi:hypothetical protein
MPRDPDHDHSDPAPDNADALDDAPPQQNMQDIIARGRNGMARAGAGSKAALIGYRDAGRALRDAKNFNLDGKYLDTRQLAGVARQMGVMNASDARDLPRFADYWADIVPLVEAAEIKAHAKGGHATYNWRRLWREVDPPKRDPLTEAPPDPPDVTTPAIAAEALAKLKEAEAKLAERETELATMRQERDDALARNADLESQLADIEVLKAKLRGKPAKAKPPPTIALPAPVPDPDPIDAEPEPVEIHDATQEDIDLFLGVRSGRKPRKPIEAKPAPRAFVGGVPTRFNTPKPRKRPV